MSKTLSLGEVQAILYSGNFGDLIGTVEDDKIECKKSPYRLNQEREKFELAKDVSGLANARGGMILIGCRTERDPTSYGDVIHEVSPFPQGMLNPQDYQNVIKDWVYPSLGVNIRWHPSEAEPDKGIVAISLSEDAGHNQPFLVTKIVDDVGNVRGMLFGFFERRRDTVSGMSAQELRDRLKDGLRFSDLDRRLENIEEALGQFAAASATKVPSITPEELRARISQARQAVGLEGKPCFILAAGPIESVQIPTLFSSRNSEVVRLLEDPPKLRDNGFDLNTEQHPIIVRGAIRRCMISSYKLLELGRDGLLIFVARGDSDFLAWSSSDPSQGLAINTWVLVEATYLFSELALKLAPHAQPVPSRIQLSLALEDMSIGGIPCRLMPHAPKPNHAYSASWRSAPDARVMVTVEYDLRSATGGNLSYALLSELYLQFGFEGDVVPLADRSKTPPVIDPALIAGKK